MLLSLCPPMDISNKTTDGTVVSARTPLPLAAEGVEINVTKCFECPVETEMKLTYVFHLQPLKTQTKV